MSSIPRLSAPRVQTPVVCLELFNQRTLTIHRLQQQLLHAGRTSLHELLGEDPSTLIDRALTELPVLDVECAKKTLAHHLYDDSLHYLQLKPIKTITSLVNALTVPILKNHIEIVKPNNLASQTSQIIKLRCEEAARYLYPKKLAQAQPSLTANQIPMPRSTQFFMQQVLEGKILTMHPLPQQGKNSQIFQCQFTKTHNTKLYIAKIPNTSGIQREQMSNLRFAQTSDHIVRLEAMTADQLFFEHCECGDLCAFLISATPTPENFKKFCTTIVKALIELASQGYCHSDIKPDNVFLLEGYTRVKLGDLDAVHHLSQLNFTSTLYYQAPELFTSKEPTTMATDVFSFGIIILIYMSGCFLEEYCPITSSDPVKNIVTIRTNAKIYQIGQQKLLEWLIKHDKMLNKKDPQRIFRRLVMACLAYHPAQRPGLKAIEKLLEETLVGFEELNISPRSEQKRKGQQHL